MYQGVLWSVSGRVLVNVPGSTMECVRWGASECTREYYGVCRVGC